MKRKGQSAMEYLMTYGWAILIVIIVAAALYALGVFNPATFTGSTATGFTQLGAPSDWDLAAGTGTFKLKLANNKMASQVTIKTLKALLKGGSEYTFNTTNCTGDDNFMLIGPGGSVDIDTHCTNLVYNLTYTGLSSGTSYSVEVDVLYNSGGYDHTDTGTVTGVVS
ncbi:MAG: hypothetical protein KAS04_03070 [Candidatus Aenigmarchaeota archaeon]|nr:hypothetical protein [Candidatus Aenigmarchaeota archaeon]